MKDFLNDNFAVVVALISSILFINRSPMPENKISKIRFLIDATLGNIAIVYGGSIILQYLGLPEKVALVICGLFGWIGAAVLAGIIEKIFYKFIDDLIKKLLDKIG